MAKQNKTRDLRARVDEGLYQLVAQLAEEKHQTPSVIVRDAIVAYLAKIRREEGPPPVVHPTDHPSQGTVDKGTP